MMQDDEPAMEMNEETPEVNDDQDDNSSDNDMRGAFDHF